MSNGGAVVNVIGPIHWEVRTTAIGQHQQQMGLAFVSYLREHLQHLAFEGVVPTGYTDLAGNLLGVGSVWRGPLTGSITTF